MIDIDIWFEGIRFGCGFIGTFTYFMFLKSNFLNFELDKPEINSNSITNNSIALIFFCLIGGLLPIIMDIRNHFGCFFQGFVIRATLLSLYYTTIFPGEINK